MKNINTFKLLSDYEAEKSGGVLNTPNVSFVTKDNSVRYLLKYDSYNGHAYVDLGLPSGLKWATCNVGANNPQDYGMYFAWGETEGYTGAQVTSGVRAFDDATYKAGSAASISTSLSLNDGNDAARANLGGNWRMPTDREFDELINNCISEWTEDYNGTEVAGYLLASKTNSNSIFLPAVGLYNGSSSRFIGSQGCYWTSEWYSSSDAWYLEFDSVSIGTRTRNGNRYKGFSVRGVCE